MATRKSQTKNPIFAMRLPKRGTNAARAFFDECSRVNSFLHWVLFMATHIDSAAEHARQALEKIGPLPGEPEPTKPRREGKKMVEVLKEKRQLLLEVVLTRHVDNYLNYLSSLLFEVFTERPETLRSSEKVELSTILSFTSLNEVVRAMAERRVESLSYESFICLSDFFHDRFKLDLFPPADMDVVIEAIETRNICAHNRCTINGRYLAKTKRDPASLGKKREIYVQDLEKLVPLLGGGVSRIDRQAKAKLGLRGVRFSPTKASVSTSNTSLERTREG